MVASVNQALPGSALKIASYVKLPTFDHAVKGAFVRARSAGDVGLWSVGVGRAVDGFDRGYAVDASPTLSAAGRGPSIQDAVHPHHGSWAGTRKGALLHPRLLSASLFKYAGLERGPEPVDDHKRL